VITLALAGGIASSSASGARRYLLGTAGEGIDAREADRITSLGVVLGGELRRDGRWFGELPQTPLDRLRACPGIESSRLTWLDRETRISRAGSSAAF